MRTRDLEANGNENRSSPIFLVSSLEAVQKIYFLRVARMFHHALQRRCSFGERHVRASNKQHAIPTENDKRVHNLNKKSP